MGVASLTSSIIKSLLAGQMVPDMREALCAWPNLRLRESVEGRYWDYKEFLSLTDSIKIGDLAKDVLAFHNASGGALVVGVADNYRLVGIADVMVLDTKQLNDKLAKYVGPAVEVLRNSVPLQDNKVLWLIFVPKHKGAPQRALKTGAQKADGRPLFVKGDLFYRDNDQVRRCLDGADEARVFRDFRNLPQRVQLRNRHAVFSVTQSQLREVHWSAETNRRDQSSVGKAAANHSVGRPRRGW